MYRHERIDLIRQYVDLLAKHDQSYHYLDDHARWKEAHEISQRLGQLGKRLDEFAPGLSVALQKAANGETKTHEPAA